MSYAAMMGQALAEFRAWEDGRPSLRIHTETVVFERPPRRPRCVCGALHFAKGQCYRHYMHDYNARRARCRRGDHRPHYSRDNKRTMRAVRGKQYGRGKEPWRVRRTQERNQRRERAA